MKNQDTNHVLVKALLRKGWNEFEIYHSAIKNEYQGWWIECGSNKSSDNDPINGLFLGCTLKDALFTVRKCLFTKDLFIQISNGGKILETFIAGAANEIYYVDNDGRRQDRIDNSIFRLLQQHKIISSEDSFYKGSTNTYYKVNDRFNQQL